MVSNLNPRLIKNKRVLLRVDLNLPMLNGNVLSTARWRQVLPTVNQILSLEPEKLVLVSHLGQPKGYDPKLSLSHIQQVIQKDLSQIKLIQKISQAKQEGILFLLENVRFDSREKVSNQTLIDEYLNEIDIVVFDAFSVGHRNHGSVCGIMSQAKTCLFGPAFLKEKHAIDNALARSGNRVAILSGSKISTKLPILKKMLTWADRILVGGGIANTLLHANGLSLKQSLVDLSSLDDAKRILAHTDKIILPIDGVDQNMAVVDFNNIQMKENDAILDIGPATCQLFSKYIDQAQTVLWNGPMGYYENENFQVGTQKVALAIAESSAFAIIGGGDSVAAVEDLNIEHQFDYISTSGGAFLHYIANGSLPVLEAAKENKVYSEEIVT